MTARAHGDPDVPAPSPYVWGDRDFAGKLIEITIEYDNATRVITAAHTYRDIGCVYKKILVGLGDDGTPDSTGHAFTCPTGTRAIQPQVLAAQGFSTITQFQAQQITAGR